MLDFQRGIDLRKHPRWTPSEAERHRGVVWMEYVLDRKGRVVCVTREEAEEMQRKAEMSKMKREERKGRGR